jgi:hypothetical protein
MKDPSLLIEGTALFYRGFIIVNSLDDDYLKPLIKIANLYDLFERSTTA